MRCRPQVEHRLPSLTRRSPKLSRLSSCWPFGFFWFATAGTSSSSLLCFLGCCLAGLGEWEPDEDVGAVDDDDVMEQEEPHEEEEEYDAW